MRDGLAVLRREGARRQHGHKEERNRRHRNQKPVHRSRPLTAPSAPRRLLLRGLAPTSLKLHTRVCSVQTPNAASTTGVMKTIVVLAQMSCQVCRLQGAPSCRATDKAALMRTSRQWSDASAALNDKVCMAASNDLGFARSGLGSLAGVGANRALRSKNNREKA